MVEEKTSSLQQFYESSFKEVKDGQIVRGKIVAVNRNEVLVDIGYKSEGIIPITEFSRMNIEMGMEIEVYVESIEDDSGTILLSYEKAQKLQGWDKITHNCNDGTLVDGIVRKKIKGGYLVDVFGIEGFLPASLSSFRNMSDKDVLDKQFKFKLEKVNNFRRSIILSRKEAVQKEREENREKVWAVLKIGDIRSGTVKSITDFGAFIDLGGVDGLLHITDMSWAKTAHPSEVVAVGDKIDVMILNLDKKESKVSLGLKQRLPDPWVDIEAKFPIGSKVKGKIVNILPYGVFVELEKGIEGLIHITEISWAKRVTNLQGIFAIGDMVEVQVLNIDKEAHRISLSIKQLEANPWLDIENKYPIRMRVTGKIRGFAEYGVFVELDNNLEGMVHISDLSWTKRINHPQDILKKGQKIDTVVLAVDGANRKISLGLKQLEPNPWPDIAVRYPVGTIVNSEIIQLSPFGVFVKLDDTLEGLIYSSEIDKEVSEKLKPGDHIQVKVIKVDVEQAKIGLSSRIE